MDVLRKYRHFVNEAVDSDKEVRIMNDVPTEVIQTAKKIATDIYHKVRKPTFDFIRGQGLVMKFFINEQDFRYIDEESDLSLDVVNGAKSKREYDVKLIYLDKVTETFEVSYLVTFDINDNTPDNWEEDEEDVVVNDEYEKPEEEDYFDEDEADNNIKKGKIKIEDIDELEDVDDEV